MAVKIEVGKTYELNNGDVRECVRVNGDDHTAVDEYGFGPFFIGNIGLYHQDGRFAACDLDHDLSVKRCVSDTTTRDPELTSPYGDGNHPLPDVTSASDSPKTWGDMTDAEKGAMLLAWQRGGQLQYWDEDNGQWESTDIEPVEFEADAYRIKPEPKRETVTSWWGDWGFTLGNKSCRDTHRITFTTTNGEPDLDSIKMERINE